MENKLSEAILSKEKEKKNRRENCVKCKIKRQIMKQTNRGRRNNYGSEGKQHEAGMIVYFSVCLREAHMSLIWESACYLG